MAKRANSKAAKIRALLAERPDAKATEIVATLAAQKIKVTAGQVYNLKSTMGKTARSNGKPAAKKAGGFEALI
jgi:hypothetical protein